MGGTSGAPLKPLRDDSALRALSSLRGLRGAPAVPPLCRETSVSRTANVGTVGKNGLIGLCRIVIMQDYRIAKTVNRLVETIFFYIFFLVKKVHVQILFHNIRGIFILNVQIDLKTVLIR